MPRKDWETRLDETVNFIRTINLDTRPDARRDPDFASIAKLIDIYLEHYTDAAEKERISNAMSQGGMASDSDLKKEIRKLKRAIILIKIAREKKPISDLQLNSIKQSVNQLDANFRTDDGKVAFLKNSYGDLVRKQARELEDVWTSTNRFINGNYAGAPNFLGTLLAQVATFRGTPGNSDQLNALLLLDVQQNGIDRSDSPLKAVGDRQVLLLVQMLRGITVNQLLERLQALTPDLEKIRKLRVDLEEAQRLLPDVRSKYEQVASVYQQRTQEYEPNKNTVFSEDEEYLVYNSAEAPPVDRSSGEKTGSNAEEMISLGRKVLWIVRAICCHGTFNNRLKLVKAEDPEISVWKGLEKLKEYEALIKQAKTENWTFERRKHAISRLQGSQLERDQRGGEGEVMRRYRFIIPLANPANTPDLVSNPKWLIRKGETLWGSLKGEVPNDIPRQRAAYGKGTYLNKGGVCEHLSHLTLGILTLLAPKNTLISIVTHSADHSFVVIAKDSTDWFIVDPWIGSTYVCPITYAYFQRDSGSNRITRNTEIRVIKPVNVPYGVAFSDEQIRLAMSEVPPKPADRADVYNMGSPDNLDETYKKARIIKANYLPDHDWCHLDCWELQRSRTITDRARTWKDNNSPLAVAEPEEWGAGVFDSVKARLSQQALRLIDPPAIAQSLSNSAMLFPHFASGLNYALSNEPILLNGMKVIFDQPISVYPVTLESKAEAGRNDT